MKRYDLRYTRLDGEHMADAPEGDYVRYSDVKKMMEELRKVTRYELEYDMVRRESGDYVEFDDIEKVLRDNNIN